MRETALGLDLEADRELTSLLRFNLINFATSKAKNSDAQDIRINIKPYILMSSDVIFTVCFKSQIYLRDWRWHPSHQTVCFPAQLRFTSSFSSLSLVLVLTNYFQTRSLGSILIGSYADISIFLGPSVSGFQVKFVYGYLRP